VSQAGVEGDRDRQPHSNQSAGRLAKEHTKKEGGHAVRGKGEEKNRPVGS
jgi:hypothetical protein